MGRKEDESSLAYKNNKLQERVNRLEEQVESLQAAIECAHYTNYILITILVALILGSVVAYTMSKQPKESVNEDLTVVQESEESSSKDSYVGETYESVTFYKYPIGFEVILKDKNNLESISGWDLVEQEDVHVYIGQQGTERINRNFDYYKVATWKDKTIYAASIDVTECQVTWAFKEGYDVYYDGYLMDELYPEILADLFMWDIQVNEEKKILSIYKRFRIN